MEKVGNVVLDDTWYDEKYEPKDTSVEENLLEYFSKDKEAIEILWQDDRWEMLYHVSPLRKNILDWYEFTPDVEVLEIGAECGILTEILCEKVKRVTCIESSRKKSVVNAWRNQKFANLNILVGPWNVVPVKKKYDYVLLIGGLEYVYCYIEDENAPAYFLNKIHEMLKDDGKLLLAVQNKFGLKYWAGHAEDHTGRYFDSMENYIFSQQKETSFSKDELKKMLEKTGYSAAEFYYPFPDHKFAQQIFSENYLPKEDDVICSLDSFSYDRLQLFDETRVFQNMIKEKKFDFFSNSFFVEAKK